MTTAIVWCGPEKLILNTSKLRPSANAERGTTVGQLEFTQLAEAVSKFKSAIRSNPNIQSWKNQVGMGGILSSKPEDVCYAFLFQGGTYSDVAHIINERDTFVSELSYEYRR